MNSSKDDSQAVQADGPLVFQLHLQVLQHLGMKLYATAPSVLTELVANSWDADASQVDIVVEPNGGTLTVLDDGHGMDRDALQSRFLTVGYSRRDTTKSDRSESGARKVMGRKGIGKLAMFSIARRVELTTQVEGGKPIGFVVDVDELERLASENQAYYPTPLATIDPLPHGKGTRIVLGQLNRSVERSRDYLVPRLARRFGVVGPANGFRVRVDGHEVTRREAGVFDHLQFLWFFDKASLDEAIALGAPLAKPESLNGKVAAKELDDTINVEGKPLKIRGFIGTVDVPSRLGSSGESINHISLFVNGRLWQEDMLAALGDTRYFNSYIVGEIHADFLDADGVDRATSARESVIQHDPHYTAIRSHLAVALGSIRDQWDLWRGEVDPDDPDRPSDVLDDWVESLPRKADKKLAKKLIRSIDKVEFNNDAGRNKRAKMMLYRSTMVAFEKLRVRNALERLEDIDDVLSPEFQAIFATLDDVEESHFYDISHGRLEVIQAFEQHVSDKVLEEVIQRYLLEHLWLLDPTWDRIGGSDQYEIRLSKYLKDVDPETDEGARLDIAYRRQSGRNVVIELKRPGLKIRVDKIWAQCNRYGKAVEEYTKQHNEWMDGGATMGDASIFFITSDKSHLSDRDLRSLKEVGTTVLTYEGLITSARAAYEAYFRARGDAKSKLEGFLTRLEGAAKVETAVVGKAEAKVEAKASQGE